MNRTESTPSAQVLNKRQPEEFDLVILGGGTGSTVAAWTFAGEGKQVAVVERKYIGGSCPNIACLPSKNVIHSAKVASYFRRGKEFGITHDGFTISMADVRERKRRMVRGLNDMYIENYRNTGAEFILGAGRFVASRTVEVTMADGNTRQQPAVYAHQRRRFPRSPCQFNRRQPCDYGKASPVLSVYRPGARSNRPE
jgi:pyruvate/2-oxoglutarate dehydrogenase complex dihydrolipoamide dehydrogenase (E3) component